ncbi:MAG: uroporphyrinogen-III C-methyltransferase [Chloroflexi bacterium]|nr:uroporphyrinogen-III C-methyltransferase [Chloroflexota bacterium]
MHKGTVYLVGAGPGDPGLLTLRAHELLQQADVVVYDRLVDERILRYARPDAEVTYAGKWPRRTSNTQEDINQHLIDYAQQGKSVVRLKGGDPFVFGRGGEEAIALLSADVPFEVVPGVTSAIAVPAYAGIPVTHRGVSASFTVVSGSEDPGKPESQLDWASLAAGAGTLILLMAWETLPNVVEALIAHGKPADTPAALIQWGARPEQRTVEGTLANILQRGKEAGLEPPVVAVFGDVVALRSQVRWYDSRPLFGVRVLVTRARPQASVLADLLAQEGALAVETPAIQIAPPEDDSRLRQAAQELPRYRWAVFTSVNGVDAFWEAVRKEGLDARAFAGVRIAAIGPATAEALQRRGLSPDLVPSEYVAEALAEALRPTLRPGDRVLLPRAAEARAILVDALSAIGVVVDEVPAYQTVLPDGGEGETPAVTSTSAAPVGTPLPGIQMLRDGNIDVVTFASSSTVRNLVQLLGGDIAPLQKPLIACIGPITADTARTLGLHVDIQAADYTIPGLVEAIKAHFHETA